MKKKLIFCICILLSIIMCATAVPFSAYTYDCSVEVTSASVLIANFETDTFVYEKNANTAHYISYLSNLMTFIVTCNNATDLDEEVSITQELIDSIPNSDSSLDPYVGKTLTVTDLLNFIMLTNGNDACYALADHVTKGNRDDFVALMNKKAREIGCTKTKFSSVAARNNTTQFSTCNDLYKIIKYALTIPVYREIASQPTYLPTGYKDEKLTISNTNSLLRNKSPYYFKHIKNGKYGADSVAKGNVIAVSEYADVSYACIILGAQQLSEHNAFTETRQLLSWAYTKLGNKQIISESTVLATVTAESDWGESDIALTAGKDIVRTVPAKYDASKMSFEFDSPSEVKLPVFMGQNMGKAQVYYEGKLFDEIDLISSSAVGISMLSDISSFAKSMLDRTIIPVQKDEPAQSKETETQAPSEPSTEETKTTQAE